MFAIQTLEQKKPQPSTTFPLCLSYKSIKLELQTDQTSLSKVCPKSVPLSSAFWTKLTPVLGPWVDNAQDKAVQPLASTASTLPATLAALRVTWREKWGARVEAVKVETCRNRFLSYNLSVGVCPHSMSQARKHVAVQQHTFTSFTARKTVFSLTVQQAQYRSTAFPFPQLVPHSK